MFWLRLAVSLFLALLGVLAVARVPVGALWKPAVGATAFGVWLIPIAALVTWSGDRDLPGWMALAAALLLATPLLRAVPVASTVRALVHSRFGERPWRGAAPPRAAPYTLSALFLGAGGRGVAPEIHVFSDQGPLSLDLHRGAGPGPHPVVVTIHGGSWNSGERTQLPAVNHYLAARGITVAAITYRFAPEHPFPAQLDDVHQAIRWLREHARDLDLDPERIVLHGRSAGGHLALLAAYTSSDPGIRGVVALYPPTDQNWSWEHPSNPWVLDSPKTLSEFLGGTQDQVPEAFDAASPIRFVNPQTPPTLLIHGGRDELVFTEQSRRLDRVLDEAGVPHALVETPWDTHGLDANLGGPGGQLYLWSLERFLGSVLGSS